MDVEESKRENYCVLLHNQRVIRFSYVITDTLLTVHSDLFYYDVQEENFRLDRTEKFEINGNRNDKFQLQQPPQCKVIKDFKLGFRVPVYIIIISTKKKFCLHALILDQTGKKGSQLRIYHQFPLPNDPKMNLIFCDGPNFLYYHENRLKLIYYNSKEYKTNETFPIHLPNFVLCSEIDSSLYFIDSKNGFLMNFCVESEELACNGALISEDFMQKCLDNKKEIDYINIQLNLNDTGQSLVHVCYNSELFEFQNGRLIKSVLLQLNYKIVNIFLYNGIYCNFLIILSQDGTLCAVNAKTYEIVNRWSEVERIGIDDVLFRGNKFVLIQYKSDSMDFLNQLNEKSLITDVVNVFYPKENIVNKTVETNQMSVAAKAIENKLKVGIFMLEDAQLRLNEKEEFIKQSILRIQKLSANGILNSAPVYPVVTDIISPLNKIEENLSQDSTLPLKILEINDKKNKEFWLIRLKIENQSNRTLGNFVLHLICAENSFQFRVKFFREENFIPEDIGLRNLLEFKNYFSAESPTVKPTEKMELIASVHLTEPIFENLVVNVQISVIFGEINEEDEIFSSLRQQLCGSLMYKCEVNATNSAQQIFDIWSLSTLDRSIVLEIHSTETNLKHIQQLLCDNLSLSFSKVYNIFYSKYQNDPLSNVAIQISSKITEHETKIRIHYNSDTEIIFLLHLMYSNLPTDLVFTPTIGNLQALTNILKTNLQQELDIIRELISSQTNSPPIEIPTDLNADPPLKYLGNLRKNFAQRQKWLQESRNGKIDFKIYKKLKEKLDKIEQETDLHVGLFSDINVPYYKQK